MIGGGVGTAQTGMSGFGSPPPSYIAPSGGRVTGYAVTQVADGRLLTWSPIIKE